MLGFAARLIGKTAKMGVKAGWSLAKGTAQLLPGATKLAANTGLFAIRHPYMTVGAIGAGAYLATDSGSPYSSPSLSREAEMMSLNIQPEMAALDAMNTGIAPMATMMSGAAVRNQRLMQSTMGLVQGLHAGRH